MSEENETIQEDVSSLDTTRLDAIKSIANRQKEEREADDSYVPVEEVDRGERSEEAESDDLEQDLDNDIGDTTPESPVYLKDGKWMTKEKVNGQEREVEFDKVLATAQKNEAADVRLYEAGQRLKEAELREQQLAERENLLSQQNQLPAKGVDENGVSLEDLYQKQHDALMEGDDDLYKEVSKELAEEQRRLATSAINPDEIVQRAKQELSNERKAEVEAERARQIEAANIEFQEEHKDIVEDEGLFTVTNQFSAAILTEHPEFTPKQNLDEAAKRTRAWLAGRSNANFEDVRTNRKKQSSGTGGSNARSPIGKDAPKPKTRSETIRELALARGQSI